MIQVKHLYKSFDDKMVLKDINTSFLSAKTNLIIGSSGSGKTVLLKCMLGLMPIDSGEILFDKLNLAEQSDEKIKELRTQMGMLFQGSALFDSKTVEENVMFPLDMFTKYEYEKKLEIVNSVLHRVQLDGANPKFPSEISGGMMKRVALARAIVLRPKFLFCDEPNSGLDPKTSIVIDKLIKEITEEYKMTTVINTHDMNTVLGIGDHIVYLYQGQVEWQGTKEEILRSENENLNDFIFASDFLQNARKQWESS